MTPTDTAIRKLRPTDKPFKLGDSAGLYLLIKYIPRILCVMRGTGCRPVLSDVGIWSERGTGNGDDGSGAWGRAWGGCGQVYGLQREV